MAKEVKPLSFTGELEGISKRQIDEHHDVLYAGYVKKWNEIQDKLTTAPRDEANGTFSLVGELKRQETFALNGIKLHESYFANLGGNGEISGQVAALISRDYGSVEAWTADFKAFGLAARGWVVLAYDLDDQKLYNYSLDAHNAGLAFSAVPLIVLDVYEHAYFLDYATGRKAYIEAFFKNLNVGPANQALSKLGVS